MPQQPVLPALLLAHGTQPVRMRHHRARGATVSGVRIESGDLRAFIWDETTMIKHRHPRKNGDIASGSKTECVLEIASYESHTFTSLAHLCIENGLRFEDAEIEVILQESYDGSRALLRLTFETCLFCQVADASRKTRT